MSRLKDSARYRISQCDDALVKDIVQSCQVSPLAARVMVARGITTVEHAQHFLAPSLDRDWLDPFVIPHMAAGVDRILQAIEQQETIAVFGDFDVDGISATAVLTCGLRSLGAQVHPYIPKRFGEGYGLSEDALWRVIEDCDPSLIITVDTGVSSRAAVDWLVSEGIDVVVSDHHEPSDLVPEGVPVINPKLDADNPSRDLAGVGVALKIVQVLGEHRNQPLLWRTLTDIAALGTISDMMELAGENRALVDDGVLRLQQHPRCGIFALAEASATDITKVSADSLGYSIIPRLNAAGRMSDPVIALELLLCDDLERAHVLAGELESINIERREIEADLVAQAIAQVEESFNPQSDRVIVVAGHGWHEGVKGIAASRLTHLFHVPALLFTISDGVARGSARSVGSVDLFRAVESCADLLMQFGGHAGAVGITLDVANLDALRDRLNAQLMAVPAEDFEDKRVIDAVVEVADLSRESIASLDRLRPFGQGNRMPLFALENVVMLKRGAVGKTKEHLRFVATDGKGELSSIMFRAPDINELEQYEGVCDIVFEVENDEWQGRVTPKAKVKDILMRKADTESLMSDSTGLVHQLFLSAEHVLRADERASIARSSTFHTSLVRVTFAQQQAIIATLTPGDILHAVRMDGDELDPHAIALFTADNQLVGYLNSRVSKALAPLLDQGIPYTAEVTQISGARELDCFGNRWLGVDLFMRRGVELTGDQMDDQELMLGPLQVPQARQLATLSNDELLQQITQSIAGISELFPTQERALALLDQGTSLLAVMATGRGKSLIFQAHAARLALLKRETSIFVYPLRALVNDQAFHIAQAFSALGLVAHVLTGETPPPRRREIESLIASGTCDVVLTTPEFLAIHTQSFEGARRIGFVALDEAHHMGVACDQGRCAYAEMPRILKELGNPVVAAFTATAPAPVMLDIKARCAITEVLFDNTRRENLIVEDMRNTRNREARLVNVVASGEKTIIYVNSRDQSVQLARMLRKRIWEMGERIAFYNAALSREDRLNVEAAFRNDELTCIVATSAFGEGVNLPGVRHVMLYHFPFDEIAFNQMCGRAGRDGHLSTIHLLYGASDARYNQRILQGTAPSRSDLAAVYRALQEAVARQHQGHPLKRQRQDSTAKPQGVEGQRADQRPETHAFESGGACVRSLSPSLHGQSATLTLSNAEIAQRAQLIDQRSKVTEHTVSTALGIFIELGFLHLTGYGSSRLIHMVESPQKVELESSIRYLEGMRQRDEFIHFCDWALCASPLQIQEHITSALMALE